SFYGLSLKPFEVQGFLDNEIKKSIKGEPKNLEEKAISLIGRPLYEAFIRGYTLKQWGIDPVKLDAEIFNRLPVRHNYDTRYFTDPWQGIPKEGYSALFNNLLSSSKIDISLKTDYFEIRDRVPKGCTVIFTGPIDSFFDYKYGHLNWRSLRFETMYHDVADYQGTSVVNYADQEIPYTRIHEFKHYHPERRHEVDSTIVYKEFPLACTPDREPYYPVGTKEDRIHFKEYLNKASRLPNVIFGGRLGLYQYLNMDQVVLQALDTFDKKVKKKG
ncbi:MAG: UDP-galactopyranose mutase, partial [Nitrospinota bacterium]